MPRDVLASVRQELEENIDPKTRDGVQRFFKEEVRFHGVKSEAVRKIAAKHFQEIKGREKAEIFSLCRDLLETGYGEEASIAFLWAYSLRSSFKPADFDVFEGWLESYVDNWAKCDTLCNHTLGSFLEMYPEFMENLKSWARSENRWLRRASAVTLILPARKGLFLEEAFAISDILLLDKDDMVQKGYGWLLKEASKKNQERVFDFVMRRKADMPRTALRYAIEKMPSDMKKKAMAR
jgi:3-methyladenine DNA glycosylase AlkD